MKGLKGLILCVLMMAIAYEVAAQFAEVTNTGLPDITASSVEWGDYDNDGDLDVLIAGMTGASNMYKIARIFRNNGNYTFTDINAGLMGIDSPEAKWGDFDNDGDLDVLIRGNSSVNDPYLTPRVYRNDGNDVFTDIGISITPISVARNVWGDIDNDGYVDMIVSGTISTDGVSHEVVNIHINNGDGTFSYLTTSLPAVSHLRIIPGDYDNDGDLDFTIPAGGTHPGVEFYINNGNGQFSVSQQIFGDYIAADGDSGDFDNDGDLDLVISGMTTGGSRELRIFRNDGNLVFEQQNTSYMQCGGGGSTLWGDYDNDGDLDIFYTGQIQDPYYITKLYRNDGNGNFTEINTSIATASREAAWGDVDGDGDLDILTTHWGYVGGYPGYVLSTRLYINTSLTNNQPPSTPSGLEAHTAFDKTVFNWNMASDDHTPALGLNYELRIGSTPGGCDLVSPMSSDSGYRKVSDKGYVNSNCSWKIQRSVLPDSFYWSVQAIDSAFQGSAFAEEQSISFVPRVSLLSNAHLNFGEVPIGGWSDWKLVIIENTSLAEVYISNVHFHNDPSQYEINYPYSGLALLPGAIDTLFVRFAPSLLGAQNDTLYVVSDAVNSPLIKIRLAGLSIQVPPLEPDNLEVQMDGNSVVLCWSPVTQTVFNTPIEPDYYFVYQSTDPYGQYFLLGVTPNLTYTHALVGIGAQRMFYKITAYKYYGRGVCDLSSLGLEPGMPEEEVIRRLQE